MECRPYRPAVSPPLPLSRMTEGQAFQVTGVDYAGPWFVRGAAKDAPAVKAYVCLFTCVSVRAVHLDVVENLTTATFLRAFRRFVSRRDFPERLITDNANNFKSAAQTVQPLAGQIIEAAASQKFLSHNGVTWQFIVERAPWWGGLVGLMKRCLKKILGKALLNMIELTTVGTEIEAVLNSRPLTYVYSDIEDGPPLTPSHFLCGHRLITVPHLQNQSSVDSDYQPGSDTKQLKKRAQYHERLMKTFWFCWRKEYLVNLREFHKFAAKKTSLSDSPIAVGDVVLVYVYEDLIPGCQWRLACVEKLIIGRDGVVRAAHLRLSNGNQLNRPLQKLFPLEVSANRGQRGNENDKVTSGKGEPSKGLTKPLRVSAQEALKKIKEQTALLH